MADQLSNLCSVHKYKEDIEYYSSGHEDDIEEDAEPAPLGQIWGSQREIHWEFPLKVASMVVEFVYHRHWNQGNKDDAKDSQEQTPFVSACFFQSLGRSFIQTYHGAKENL